MFLGTAKITKLLKGFRQPSTNHNNIGILTWSCVDCQKNWASYQERKDWRFCHGFQNCEESWIRRWLSIEKPQLFCLVKSRSSTNYSNVFAKDRHSFAMWYNPDKRRDVMVGSSTISMELLQEFQLNSWHVSLFTSICQIPDFCLTPTNPMQLPFSRWYNPNKRCDVMVGSSAISIELLREFQESSPEVGEQKTGSLWRRVSLAILSLEHLQNDMWSKVLGKT